LASRAQVTFADEPTGALDTQTAAEVLTLVRQLAHAGQTIVMVTHDPVAAAYADNVLFLVDGRIVAQLGTPTVEAVAGQLVRLGASAKAARHDQRAVEPSRSSAWCSAPSPPRST
jgi:putative ABC transport system ATP-binding protein